MTFCGGVKGFVRGDWQLSQLPLDGAEEVNKFDGIILYLDLVVRLIHPSRSRSSTFLFIYRERDKDARRSLL